MKKTFIYVTLLVCAIALPTNISRANTIDKTTILTCRNDNPSCWPTAFTFTPSRNVLYVERYTGQIHLYNPVKQRDTLWGSATANSSVIATAGEQGVLGLALHPNWPRKKWVYIYYTRRSPFENRVIRLQKHSDDSISRRRLISIPAGSNHNGGTIAFGPDKNLYIVTGETGNPRLAQDTTSFAGKVLRLSSTGSVPTNNPFNNAVYSYGHRNSFGFAFDPFDSDTTTIELWQTENGPECNDEINLITRGQNYGWGDNADCPNINNSGNNIVSPIYQWTSSLALTGIAFCVDCSLGEDVNKDVLIGDWNNGNIYHAEINASRNGIDNMSVIYTHSNGILGVETDREGAIYFSDSNGIYQLFQKNS